MQPHQRPHQRQAKSGAAGEKKEKLTPNEGGMRVKELVATGPHVYVSVEAEHLQAQGTELRYTTDPAKRRSDTILRGTPVVAVRERNRLEAGNASTPAEVQ